ncbi:MAG: hypothetical protein IIA50_02955 [Bacteroidetes bacterium]|nr:hypothetical protein [Bacteroidota bacterium]
MDELAWLDQNYTTSFLDVDQIVWDLRERQAGSSLYRATLGSTPAYVKIRGQLVPIGTARLMLMQQSEVVEHQLARKRSTEVPKSSSGFSVAPPLPVDFRRARFLEEDGTTRTEIYWVIPAGGLIPPFGIQLEILRRYARLSYQHLIHVSAVQQTPEYRTRKITRERYRLADEYYNDADAPVNTTIVKGDTGLYHLALQWDQYMVYESGNESVPENLSFVKTGMHRVDSLWALSPNPRTLVMSDLVPLVAETLTETTSIRDEKGFLVPVYVRRSITPRATLALYFEAYHLLYGSDDQTHYTVSYEVAYDRKRGGLAGLLGKRQEITTAASTRHTGDSLTIREYVSLDLSEWEDAKVLRITVRLTDETTGNTAERTLEFDLVASRARR